MEEWSVRVSATADAATRSLEWNSGPATVGKERTGVVVRPELRQSTVFAIHARQMRTDLG